MLHALLPPGDVSALWFQALPGGKACPENGCFPASSWLLDGKIVYLLLNRVF